MDDVLIRSTEHSKQSRRRRDFEETRWHNADVVVRIPRTIGKDAALHLSETIACRLRFIEYFNSRTMLRIFVGESDTPLRQARVGSIMRTRTRRQKAICNWRMRRYAESQMPVSKN